MECLTDLVGIKNTCDAPVSKSGLWLQNLPGFSLKLADAAANEETVSGLTLIKEKYIYAQQAVIAQFRNNFIDKMRVNSLIENDTIGYYPQNQRPITLNNTVLKGVRIDIRNYAHLEIYISQVALFLKDGITTDVFIYDLMTGELLDTIPITIVAGQPTYVNVNKAYPNSKQRLSLFICYDAGISDTFDSSINGLAYRSTCSSCMGYGNKYAFISGAKIDKSLQKISGNISSNNGSSGLSFTYSLNCNIDNLLCSIAGKFAWPLLHKWGAEIMAELQHSRRLNSIITIDRDKNIELRKEYEDEYYSSMRAIFDNIKMPKDICFSCNSSIKKVIAIP